MDNKLAQHYTFSKLFKFTIPTILMMIFTSIYSIVDGFFISNYVGKTAFAAVNFIWPALMILASLGFMVGTGGSAIVGKLLGQNKKEEANKIFTLLIIFTLVLGVITSILGVILVKPIAILIGASESMLNDATTYGRIIATFNFSFMLQYFFQSFFVTATKPRLGFGITIIAGITNIILDYVLVGLLGLGVVGAAVASGIGQCIGGLVPIIYFFNKRNTSLLRITKPIFDKDALIKTCTNGSSELMSSISSSLVGMLYNYQLMKFSGENGVAAYGVLMYTQMIFQAIYLGYTIGTNPIISYNYGAKNNKELNNILIKSFKIIGITGVVMFGSCFLLSKQISMVFVGYDLELMNITITAFKIYAVAFIFSGINIYASGFFTALGNGKISAFISFSRCLLFQVVAILILPSIFGLNGIWWALSVAEIAALFVSGICFKNFDSTYHYF